MKLCINSFRTETIIKEAVEGQRRITFNSSRKIPRRTRRAWQQQFIDIATIKELLTYQVPLINPRLTNQMRAKYNQ
jgi:hypothetical protein